MKKIVSLIALIFTSIGLSQNISMQNGTFNRCAPDKFFDSGGEFSNYGNNENFTTTICPQNSNEFIILDFIQFSTQLNIDILTIYDGDDTSATVLGTYSGTGSPNTISASTSNPTGCLTITYSTDSSGNTTGWQADILCATPCQDILASIDSTVPAPNESGVLGILPGETIDFSGSATFSNDGTNAVYNWDFGDGNSATGMDVDNTFTTEGTYTVTLNVTDDNPQGCSNTTTITVFVLGANVIVDQNTFTPEQLIENVLVNSPCASVSNIISSTGSDFVSFEPNGIGYFLSNGIDFPFEDGVLLTSGNASEARGPNNNAMSAGGGGWPGDAELDAAVGINSNNASFIQFDFTPLSDNISFEFLMASEEYDMGGFECQYSDAFAFLLTDSNGNTTNLAVLPGTNTPILVTNIHPDNGSCPAINEEYFGEYIPNNGPPISFDGRTDVFTAQSSVVPGEQYTIKLVVADATDTQLDSGVFLRAGSFDLGGELGDDITIESGTAQCGGTPVILDTGVSSAMHTWYYEGEEISGATGSMLEVNEAGNYSVDVVFSGVCQTSDSIYVEFRVNPLTSSAEDLTQCNATGTAEFDLSENDNNVLGSQNADDVVITYHLNEQDALDNVGALPTNYTNTSNPQIIWARIADTSQLCFDTTSFTISTSSQPTINPVTDLEVCDDLSNNGLGEFDLSVQTLGILGGQTTSDFVVSYHLSFSDADAGTAALPLSYTSSSNAEPIYVRVESVADAICYNASIDPVFNLIVNYRAIANQPSNMEVCDDTSNDGISTFDLSTQDSAILGAQDPSIYTVSYHVSLADAEANVSPLPSNYTNTAPNIEPIYARVEDPSTPQCYGTTTFNLVVNPLPQVVDPTPLEVCDDATADGTTEIDLSLKNTEITGNNSDYSVSYYGTQSDAEAEVNPLPLPYTNTSNPEVVVVRVEDITTGCYATTTLELIVEQAPVAFTPEALRYCDPDNDGFGVFNLTAADNAITGGASGVTVSYHETLANASNGVDAIADPLAYSNIVVSQQTLYARVESATVATSCATVVELELIVEPTPQIESPTALETCDDTAADGFAMFDLTTKEAEVLDGQDSGLFTISYYDTQANAETSNNPIGNVTAYTNSTAFNQTLWIRVEYTATIAVCYKLVSLELIVHPLPEVIQPTALELCDDLGESPGDEQTVFNLREKDTEITSGNGSLVVSYYETQADAQSQSNVIATPTQYTNTSVNGLAANPQTLYVVVSDIDTGCVDYTTLTLRVLPNPTPTPSDQLPDIALCDVVNTGDGVEVFDLTENETLILNGETGVTPSYHESAEDADEGINAIVDPTQYTNILSPEQDIYVRVTNDTSGCYAVVSFTIRVQPLPAVVAVTDFIYCELNTDGIASFDLTAKDAEVLNGQDPLQYVVSYHISLADAQSQSNALVSPYTNLSNPQQLFVAITNTDTSCSISTQSFNIEVQEAAEANPDMVAIVYEQCDDTMQSDDNPANDSVQFDLTTQNVLVLDGQDPVNYKVTYFATEAEANFNVNPLPYLYENIVNPQVIYARVDNDTPDSITGSDSSICYAVAPLTLQVNPLPELNLQDSYILCIDTNGTEVLGAPVIDTGLSETTYSFEWSYNGEFLPGETGSSITPDLAGTYSVTVTDTSTSTATSCSSTDTTEVIESAPPELEVNLVTQAFADNHIVEAQATGIGVYEYSLDGGPWQDQGVFTNVSPGEHQITARDKNGCGSTTEPIYVIDYPLYFTPNGDGNNDRWNIGNIGSSAKIYIFDRYGKLLKQLSPTGSGWNGTFNGMSMPTNDYWFTVIYNEPLTGERKEFKAHFTLKR